MEISEKRHGNVVVLAIQGSLDVMTSPELEKRLVELLDAGIRDVVFDLARTDYVSSAGLRVFMLVMKRLQKDGRTRFCGMNKQVRQVFDIAGLSFRASIFGTLEEALK